ncbi:hypothetical protein IFM89_019889 [Coptis chinensis]|uniref:Uncharacterized protein n=1 Tax=Coptis chinensis TaxID=261450 RepID=A0A835HCY0_9MAGN|nr:hypothetical protein IFM89_019889 [Coptis chinensis]
MPLTTSVMIICFSSNLKCFCVTYACLSTSNCHFTPFSKSEEVKNAEDVVQDQAVFFDILGTYMVVYRQSGYPAVVSLGLSWLSVLLMWIFSLSFSVTVSFILPLICSSLVPYIASHGTLFKIGSSYVALVWLISPAFAYGFLEATLSPVRPPKPLKIVTLVLGMAVPIVLTAGIFIRLVGTVIGIVIRYDWTRVTHLLLTLGSGAKRPMIIVACALFGLTVSAVLTGIVPPFTEDIARTVNGVDGWHIIQFSGGKAAPKKFNLTLFWMTTTELEGSKQALNPLLKLRTDLDKLTPKAERVLQKLPPWCTVFGKSTSPHTLAFLTSLPVDF